MHSINRRATESNFQSVQFSCSVVSNSLWPHESQHARPPCPTPAPRVHSDSRPLSQWCHPAISSSVIPFSSCPNPSQHQSLFQHHSSKASILRCSAFFTVHFSHPYMTTGKTIALTRQTFVSNLKYHLIQSHPIYWKGNSDPKSQIGTHNDMFALTLNSRLGFVPTYTEHAWIH